MHSVMFGPQARDEWFVSEGGKMSGPFTERRIVELYRWGKVSGRAFLCDVYGSAWIPIRHSALARVLAELEVEPAGVARSPRAPVRDVPVTTARQLWIALWATGIVVGLVFAAFTA